MKENCFHERQSSLHYGRTTTSAIMVLVPKVYITPTVEDSLGYFHSCVAADKEDIFRADTRLGTLLNRGTQSQLRRKPESHD